MIQRQDYPTYIYLHSDLVITNYKPDVDDIKEYKGDKNVYLQLNENVDEYYEISEEQHFEYERLKEEAEHPEHEFMHHEIEDVKED